MITDLTSERPQWILSAYGPGRNAPVQLFGGPIREQSLEEMRLLHYTGEASGNPQQAIQEANKLFQASEDQIRTAVDNIYNAINFISQSNEKPNRVDICKSSAGVDGGFKTNPLNQASNSTSANPLGNIPFGSPSELGKTSPFGAPSQQLHKPQFGAPSQPGPAAQFGTASAIGQRPNPFAPVNPTSSVSPFGAYSTNSNAFNIQSQAQSSNPFSSSSQPQPSSFPGLVSGKFGAPSGQNPSPFANSNTPSSSTPFGGASSTPFGAPSPAPTNPFQASGATPTSFGAPSISANPFQTSGASSTTFCAPSALSNPFSTSKAAPNSFGAPSSGSVNPFQASNNQSSNVGNPFASGTKPDAPLQTSAQSSLHTFQSQTTQPNSNPFGAGSSGSVGNHFGTSSSLIAKSNDVLQSTVDGNSQIKTWKRQPELESYSSMGPDKKHLAMFKGRRVVYHADAPGFESGGRWQRIWCPKGVPSEAANTEMDPSSYDASTEAAYLHLHQTGSLPGGVIPMMPPKVEWCQFDF